MPIVLVVLTLTTAINARADWLFAPYMGAAATATNTLTVTPAGASPSTISDVSYKGQAFRSPIYYGLRASWLPDPNDAGFAPEVEWTHAKAISKLDPGAQDLNAFQQSHGLNFLLGNLAYRFAPACNTRCTLVVRGGAGISLPHVESTFRNLHQEQYQYGGVAWQVGAGAELHIWNFLYGVADARITRVSEKHLRGASAEVAGSFFTRHVDFGIGIRVPNR